MNRRILSTLAFMASGSIAFAGVINFDDLPELPVGAPIATITNGYAGFNWSNFSYISSSNYNLSYTPGGSGYYNGMVSAPNIAENDPFPNFQGAAPTSTATIVSLTPFDLVSADITAGWYDGLSVEVKGFNGATVEDDNTYTVNTEGPSLLTFNYDNITSVEFISFGGTNLAYSAGAGYHTIAMDNLTVAVPEPATIACVLVGLGLLGGFHRSRQKRVPLATAKPRG